MKIRKVLVICGLLISVTASTFNVSAATARAAKDCTGTITLAKTSGTGSLAKGQLSITKYAPSHYSSYMGTMVYYLDGAKGGSVTKYY